MASATKSRRPDPVRVWWTLVAAAVAVLFFYPVFLAISTSMKSQDEIIESPLGLPQTISFDAYRDAWTSVGFGALLGNSALYALAGSAIGLVLAILPAFAITRLRIFGARTLFIVLLTTLMLPPQTVIIPLYDLLADLHLLNTKLGLVVVHGIYSMSFEMLFLAGFMASLPRELEEAARSEGCGDGRLLRYIVVPLCAPAMAVAFTLNFVLIWKDLIFALTFVSAESDQPVTTGLIKFTTAQYFTEFSLPAAAVVMSQLPIVVVFLVAYRWIRQGLYVGAVKA